MESLIDNQSSSATNLFRENTHPYQINVKETIFIAWSLSKSYLHLVDSRSPQFGIAGLPKPRVKLLLVHLDFPYYALSSIALSHIRTEQGAGVWASGQMRNCVLYSYSVILFGSLVSRSGYHAARKLHQPVVLAVDASRQYVIDVIFGSLNDGYILFSGETSAQAT